MVLHETEASRLTECPLTGASLYIVQNSALERLLFDRNIVGLPFQQICLEASRLFISHIEGELTTLDDVAELIILSKGLVYQLGQAVADRLGRALPSNLIATRRVAVESGDATVEVSYSRLEADSSTLLVGDTVASGATVVRALAAYREEHRLQRLYLLSFAGTYVGARRIADYCRKHDIRLSILFGLAAFGLATNGFDLSFLHPETITDEKYRERARVQFDGKPASAVGWDFGSQVMAPQKYRQLCWMEAEKWGLHDHPAFELELEPTRLELLAGEASAFRL